MNTDKLKISDKNVFKTFKFGNRNICICSRITTHRCDNKSIYRIVCIGYSIKNPLDHIDKSLGEVIAAGRAKNKPITVLTTNNLMFLNDDIIDSMMVKLCKDIKENPHKYIAGYKVE